MRAIRHGVGPDDKPLLIMPSEYFNKLSDQDLGDVIAYIKSLPPVDNDQPKAKPGPVGRLLILVESEFLPARLIDHDAPRPVPPAKGVTEEYGEYLATICTICHGEPLSGGPAPDGSFVVVLRLCQ